MIRKSRNEAKRFSFSDVRKLWKNRHGDQRGDVMLRICRATSWGMIADERAKDVKTIDDAFVFYWIAFNALYGGEGACSEGVERDDFFRRVCALDADGSLMDAMYSSWNHWRNLLRNEYVSPDFWDWKACKISEAKPPR